MTPIEDVLFAAYDYRNEEGSPYAAEQALRAAIEARRDAAPTRRTMQRKQDGGRND